MNEEIAIYIHIPFCSSKCFYCNFYSEASKDDECVSQYIDAVCKEIMQNSDILSTRRITSVYIGGGTPSYINPKHIKKIIDLLKMFNYQSLETTIEVNPETTDDDKLKMYLNLGINRLSIGMQSSNESTLKKIGRGSSNKEEVKRVVNLASELGFNNISLDCIIGLPDESIENFKSTVQFMLDFNEKVKHISAYSLEVHKGTKIDFLIKNGYLTLPNEDLEREEKHELDRMLEENGFNRYEISNYSRPGFESKHNLKYWNKQEYLGFGAAAASYISSSRYTNVSDIQEYINGINNNFSVIFEREELDDIEDLKEYIILKLRLAEGISISEFKTKYNKNILEIYKREIDELIKIGLIAINGDRVHLTYKGEDLANIVWEKFI